MSQTALCLQGRLSQFTDCFMYFMSEITIKQICVKPIVAVNVDRAAAMGEEASVNSAESIRPLKARETSTRGCVCSFKFCQTPHCALLTYSAV